MVDLHKNGEVEGKMIHSFPSQIKLDKNIVCQTRSGEKKCLVPFRVFLFCLFLASVALKCFTSLKEI